MLKCVLNIFKIFAMRATWLYVGYFGCLMLEWGRCTPNVSNFAGDSSSCVLLMARRSSATPCSKVRQSTRSSSGVSGACLRIRHKRFWSMVFMMFSTTGNFCVLNSG